MVDFIKRRSVDSLSLQKGQLIFQFDLTAMRRNDATGTWEAPRALSLEVNVIKVENVLSAR